MPRGRLEEEEEPPTAHVSDIGPIGNWLSPIGDGTLVYTRNIGAEGGGALG